MVKLITERAEKERWINHHPYSFNSINFDVSRRLPLTESQEEMFRYNTNHIDVSAIIQEIKHRLDEGFRPRVLLPPTFYRLLTFYQYQVKRWGSYHDEDAKRIYVIDTPNMTTQSLNAYLNQPIYDISTCSLTEIEELIIAEIKTHKLGFAFGVGFYLEDNPTLKQIGGDYLFSYAYKPINHHLPEFSVFR